MSLSKSKRLHGVMQTPGNVIMTLGGICLDDQVTEKKLVTVADVMV